jgi:hypothetical protein
MQEKPCSNLALRQDSELPSRLRDRPHRVKSSTTVPSSCLGEFDGDVGGLDGDDGERAWF